MTTLDATDIVCSAPQCPVRTPRRESDDYARAKGWHVYRTQDAEHALCPGHAGNAKREPPVKVEGEQTLW
jgi:hypothetical protein